MCNVCEVQSQSIFLVCAYFLPPFCWLFLVRLMRTELNTLVKMVTNIRMPAARIHQSGRGNINRHTKYVPKLMENRMMLINCNFFMAVGCTCFLSWVTIDIHLLLLAAGFYISSSSFLINCIISFFIFFITNPKTSMSF